MAFESQWADWQPKGPTQRTDKTDKSPSVSFVSESPRHISPLDREETPQKGLRTLTDKADKRCLVDIAACPPEPASGAAAQNWRDWYEERAAIAEHDRDLPRAEAEALAFECCVVQWMNLKPPPENGPKCCVQCGNPMEETEALPFLTGDGGHIWMHDHCHAPWMRRRRAEAADALRRMGIVPPGG